MENAPAPCPYCRATLLDDMPICKSCGTKMPWAQQIQAIRDDVASRETSRLRATMTLVEEMYAAATKGTPISISTLKGIINAWLFPRAVILLGSVFGAIFLGLQTWILWNQTQFLALQTRAAQVEQAARLRDAIVANTDFLFQQRRLAAIYGRGLPPITCDESCRSTDFYVVLDNLRRDRPDSTNAELSSQILSVLTALNGLKEELQQATTGPTDLPDMQEGRPRDSFVMQSVNLARAVSRSCQLHPDRALQLSAMAGVFAMITDSAFWLERPLRDPEGYISFGAQFPQTIGNTQMGLIRWEETLTQMRRFLHPDTRSERRSPYRLSELYTDLENLRRNLTQATLDLVATCEERVRKDQVDLNEMDQRRL